MKYIFTCLLSMLLCYANAQEQTAKLLQETAKTLLQKGDYDNAVTLLEKAKLQEPDNIEILKDLCFASYLKRDFSKAIEVGKDMTEKSGADEQSFQMLGLAYKAIASYKDCAKLYKVALKKFPNSGVLYNEAAELAAIEKNMDEAIALWEKGIESDPSHSNNYYNASIYYARKNNWIRCILYSEVFLNLESYTKRADDIKDQLFTAYNNLLATGVVQQATDAKTTSTFEKNVLETLAKATGAAKSRYSIPDLVSIRTKFIVDWMQGKQKTYPFQLFAHEQYLLSQGLFEAYNYWLFSAPSSAAMYEAWQKDHAKETDGYKAFQQSRVFKLPVGEYYFAR